MRLQEKERLLKEFALELKEEGFDVYLPKERKTYCNFVKNNGIGYVECGDFGFYFSTVHKPNRQCGTGYSIERDIITPTIEIAKSCCLISRPHWGNHDHAPIKYKSWDDYLSYEINTIIEKVKL